MTTTKQLLASAAIALSVGGATAATAGASAPAAGNGVPAGKIETAVRAVSLTTSEGSSSGTETTSLTQRIGHVSNAPNAGGAGSEAQSTPRAVRFFSPAENTVTITDGAGTPVFQSLEQEAASFQQGVDDGCYVKTGEDASSITYRLASERGLPCTDDTSTVQTVSIRKGDGFVQGRVTTIPGTSFRQTESLAATNVTPIVGHAAELRFGPHPGAKVIDERG